MDEYRTVLEVRFPEPHGEEGTWQRYDEVLDPYYSNARCIENWDEDSMWPRTPTECAEDDLEHALDTVIDEQYLARVVREGTMDVRIQLFKPIAESSSWRHVSTHSPEPSRVARAYLRSAVRGFDEVRQDLRHRILAAYLAGETADSLVTEVSGRIPEDEVRGLVQAHDEAETATKLIAHLSHDPAHKAWVGISDDNGLILHLFPSFSQEINYEEWLRHGDEQDWGPDPWGHRAGVEVAERLLTALGPFYSAFWNGEKARAVHLAPSEPPYPGMVRIEALATEPSAQTAAEAATGEAPTLR
ncbi:hypothetical protein [Streptomyces erythrochromogenes]|uniref:hypothetical protein n=1 Tax=Streptomyces erythrochromogenes TaxID=285574 RepID=UPI0036FD9876